MQLAAIRRSPAKYIRIEDMHERTVLFTSFNQYQYSYDKSNLSGASLTLAKRNDFHRLTRHITMSLTIYKSMRSGSIRTTELSIIYSQACYKTGTNNRSSYE